MGVEVDIRYVGYCTDSAHEFREDADDYSMCLCGLPALDHDIILAAQVGTISEPGAMNADGSHV